MKSVSGNWKAVVILLGVVLASGCQTKAPEEKAEPAADTSAAAAETQPAAEGAMESGQAVETGETYSVVKGDHLWGIAAKSHIYGNPYHWPLIYKANADSIQDADLINPGQVLNINRGASAGEVDAAVSHAKTRGAWSLGVTEDSDKAYLAR